MERERISLAYAQDIRNFLIPPTVPRPQSNEAIKAEEILMIIEENKAKNNWPPIRNRAKLFDTDNQLKKVRLFSNKLVVHNKKLNGKSPTSKGGKKVCAMCSTSRSGVGTRYHCSICLVPLCCKKRPGFELSCLDAWHTAQDLTAQCKLRQKSVQSSRTAKRADKRSRREAFDDDTDGSGWSNGDEIPPLPPILRGTVHIPTVHIPPPHSWGEHV